MKQKYYHILIIVLLLGAVLVVAYIDYIPKQKDISKKGILKGTITIGPLCPVERFPPEPKCHPTEETYKAWQTAIWTPNKKSKISEITPDANGNYTLELPAGNYIVDFEKQHLFRGNLPANITIKQNKTTIFNIYIDTGIR